MSAKPRKSAKAPSAKAAPPASTIPDADVPVSPASLQRDWTFAFLPEVEPEIVDERALHALMKDWRHGRATRTLGQVLGDAYGNTPTNTSACVGYSIYMGHGIYTSDAEQQDVANALIAEMTASGVYSQPIVTEVLAVDNYWPAEDDHQDFFARNPTQGYCMAVAAPKVEKFRKTFARLQKD